MNNGPTLPGSPRTARGTRSGTLLLIAPLCSILLVVVLYLLLGPLIPDRIAVHVGPDGVGYGPFWLMIAVPCAIAAAAFAIGGSTAREFLGNDHWFQTQKSIAVGILAAGYGAIGVAVGTIVSSAGANPAEPTGGSVGMGLLGFLLFFIAAAWIHVAAFPRAKFETLG